MEEKRREKNDSVPKKRDQMMINTVSKTLSVEKEALKAASRIRVKRSKGFLGSQFYEEEAEERPTSFLVTQNSISKDPSSGEGDQNKGLKINKGRETSSKKIEEEIKEMDFGKFLKYFFFIAIIIAVIVLIGSQILEFQNAD